jgi:hypothetical protein
MNYPQKHGLWRNRAVLHLLAGRIAIMQTIFR